MTEENIVMIILICSLVCSFLGVCFLIADKISKRDFMKDVKDDFKKRNSHLFDKDNLND